MLHLSYRCFGDTFWSKPPGNITLIFIEQLFHVFAFDTQSVSYNFVLFGLVLLILIQENFPIDF